LFKQPSFSRVTPDWDGFSKTEPLAVFYMHNQPSVVDDLLSITELHLANCDVTELNIVTRQPQP